MLEGMKNCLDGGCVRCRNPKERFPSSTGYDLCICVHAEQNALLPVARFGISAQDATLYSTMQPCFGCAKELLQAHVKRKVFLHPWRMSDEDPEMDSQKKAEYEKIAARLDTTQRSIKTPRAKWAVSALRKKT